MRFQLRSLLAMTILSFATSSVWAQDGDVVTWVDSTGKFKVQAEFVRMDGTNVVLRKADGNEVKLPMSKLSNESQTQARDKAKALAKKPLPKKDAAPADSKGGDAKASDSKGSSSGLDSITVPPPVKFSSNATAQQFVDQVVQELKKDNPLVLWDALPPKYQQDVEQLLTTASTKLDPGTFRTIRLTRDNLIKVLRTKKDFVLGNAKLKEQLGSTDISKSYDPGLELLEAYLAPEILTPDRYKSGKIRELLGKYLVNVAAKGKALEKTLPDNKNISLAMDLNKDFAYTVEQMGSDSATLKVTVKDQASPPVVLQLVDGHWLPKPMVENWESQIAAAQQQLAQITPDQAKQIHQSVVGAVGLFVNPQIVQLQNAGSQSEFDGYIDALLEIGKGSLGGGLPAPN